MSHLFHKIGYSLRHWSEVGVAMQRKLTVYFACTFWSYLWRQLS